MNNPFLRNTIARLSYLGIWVLIAAAQIVALAYTFSLLRPDTIYQYILYDIQTYSLVFAVLVLIVWYPVRYYRNVFSIPLFLLFHLILLLAIIAISLGIGYFISNLILHHYPDYLVYFIEMLPCKLVVSALVYIGFVLFYYLDLTASEVKLQEKALEEQAESNALVPIEKLNRISVKKNKEIQFITIDKIFYIEANGDYVLIHAEPGRFLKDSTMKYWESHLPNDLFLRVHRSFIVNLDHIDQVELYEKDSYRLKMKNGAVIKASQAGYKLLKQQMGV